MRKGSPAPCALLLLVATTAAAQSPAGGEFGVNVYTTANQFAPRPAVDADGDFVVVWVSDGQDGSSAGVFGQRYAASGAPRGVEFRVNSYTTGGQGGPAVAARPRGDFVVVWASAHDGSAGSVHGQRYDAAGNALGTEFLANAYTTGAQFQPQVAVGPDGRFVVAWTSQSDGGGYSVAARRFDFAGNPLGAEMLVNTYTTGNQLAGGVGMAADGSFVVAFFDMTNARDGAGYAVFGRTFDASGAPSSGEFLVNTYTTGNQSRPSVSMSPAGDFVVVWIGSAGDGSGLGMFGRRYDAAGSPRGGDFVVNSYTTGNQYGVFGVVAHDALGNFVVTWTSDDASQTGVFAQRFDASGARRGSEFRVNTYTTGAQAVPALASDQVGNLVVAWDSRAGQDGNGFGVYGQRFGGLVPAALAIDNSGNGALEPGETVDVRPSWRNVNGAAQAIDGALSAITGPAGASYAITDGAGTYGTMANGSTTACVDCYAVSVSDPGPRPATHWDASVVETLAPATQGQQKQWALHVARSFTDVPPTSPFYRFVEIMLHHVLTTGCTPTEYCPGSSTTREQMAVFVLVAKERQGYLPPACSSTPMFADVPPSSPFCRWIEELARRGVVSGCGGGNYCPQFEVSREQMAVFVLRTLDAALNPPACGAPMFADVPPTSVFCRWIEELARRGVVTGCGSGNYCPTDPVTREQMGVFIAVTFGLALYGL